MWLVYFCLTMLNWQQPAPGRFYALQVEMGAQRGVAAARRRRIKV